MIFNEIAQWLVLALLGFFLLGAYRLIAISPASGVLNLDQESGPTIAARLPKPLAARLVDVLDREVTVIGFITEGCPACAQLIEKVRNIHVRPSESDRIGTVLVAHASPQFVDQLVREEAADIVVFDEDGSLLAANRITATPYIVVVDDDLHVRDKRVSSDPTEMLDAIRA